MRLEFTWIPTKFLPFHLDPPGSAWIRVECPGQGKVLPVPPAGGWRVGGGSAHLNSARPDVNKPCQALLINVVSIHHHCPLSFVMTMGKVFFHLFSVLLLLT